MEIVELVAKYGFTAVAVILWVRLEKVHEVYQAKYEALLAETIRSLTKIEAALEDVDDKKQG